MKLKILPIFVLMLLILSTTWVYGQDEEELLPTLDITGVNASDMPSVTITTTVLDSLGKPISGLTADQFRLSGDVTGLAEVLSVENVADDNLSFSTVLVIDTSSSMSDVPLRNAQEAARQFVSAIGEQDPVAIVTFDTEARVILDYTTDKAAMLDVINSLAYGGRTALYDAGLLGVDKAADSDMPRRAMILLSDGAEYGGVSGAERDDALAEAQIRGVSVYTIGLGYGFDRTYLQELSDGTNARYYESPQPEELIEIYNNLAFLLRSQYVITLNMNVPLDGTEYELVMEADTEEGVTNSDTAVVRAPIPVPLVSLPEGAFSDAISAPVTIMPIIRADDEIASIAYLIDGAEAAEGESITINPVELTPGDHMLDLTAVDADGDSGRIETAFTVAALASEVTLNWDKPETVSTPQTITLDVSGQTAATEATFSLADTDTSVSELPFSYSFDPFELAPGEQTLMITVVNEAGVTTTVEESFAVAALEPRLSISGLEPGTVLTSDATVSGTVDGQTAIRDITARFDDADAASVMTENGFSALIDVAALGNGSHTLVISAEDASGQTSEVSIAFEVALPTPLPTDAPTDMPTEAPTDVPTEVPTDVPTEAPTDVPTESVAVAPTDEPTEVAAVVEPVVTIEETAAVEPVESTEAPADAEETPVMTEAPEEPTGEPEATLTPVEVQEVEAEQAPPDQQDNTVIFTAAGLLVLLLLILIWFLRRRR